MPTVRNVTRNPAGAAVAGATVRIALVAGTDEHAAGYTGDGTVVGTKTTTSDATGLWTADLPGNSTYTPADTYYQVTEVIPGGSYTHTIIVPPAGGPYDLADILAVAPTPPAGVSAVVSVAGRTGAVVLAAADVSGVETPAGATAKVAAHAAAVDPHADRAYTDAEFTERAASAWTEPSYGAGIAGSAGAPWAVPGSRLEPMYGLVRLRGRINTNVATSYTGGATIATLPVGNRPATEIVLIFRSGGTGSATSFLTITTGGLISFATSITLAGGQTAWFQLDGIVFPAA